MLLSREVDISTELKSIVLKTSTCFWGSVVKYRKDEDVQKYIISFSQQAELVSGRKESTQYGTIC